MDYSDEFDFLIYVQILHVWDCTYITLLYANLINVNMHDSYPTYQVRSDPIPDRHIRCPII